MRLSDYGLRTLLTCCAMTGVLLLSAVSTINRMNDCRSGDWQLIGNKDGRMVWTEILKNAGVFARRWMPIKSAPNQPVCMRLAG
jgi:hypothetical protein